MTQKRGEQTLADIVRAAARLFALHGYYHTSLGDILDEITLSKGAFYYHFRSKEHLALAVLEQLRHDYQQRVFIPLRQIVSPRDRLEKMFALLRQLNESGTWCNCLLLARLVMETASSPDALALQIAEQVTQHTHVWEELITDAQAAGLTRSGIAPIPAAKMMVTGWLGGVILQEHDKELFPLADTLASLQTTLMKKPPA